ncbi:uncharacterized protein LOC133800081 [Humulus lupulus]|uniref:uncharacterized protein LOC133800081 n=1 Tax=Humulus lupulus TaxID=3486 RepID=UPI002B40D409|nr:uncharacterized protein LOC133800081 [Humulus lupulus]
MRPEIQAPQFELKPVMFQMLQTVGQSSGMPTEDPHLHLRSFLEVSDSFKLQGVSEEALRLKLFPFSLRDRARSWLNTLPPDSVTNWNDLAEKFLRKYFPPTRNAKFRSEIMSFQQLEDESTSDAWERFKELLRKCPHHGIPHCIQMETFYNGLNAASRMVLDASANGAILFKFYNEAFEILERIASNNYQWSNIRAPTSRKVAGVLEVDALTAQMASMTNILKNMSMGGNVQPAAAIQSAEVSCVYCGDGHTFENFPSNPASVFYVGNQNSNRNNNPYSNTYNPAWRHHPNLSWGGQGASSSGAPTQEKQSYPPRFSQQPRPQQPHQPQGSQTSSLENLMRDYMAKNDAVIQSQCKVVTLRSGKNLELNEEKDKQKNEPTSIQIGEEKRENLASSAAEFTQNATTSVQQSATEKCLSKPPPPFPQRFQKQQQDGQFQRFLDVLKQLHINIPLVEALEQMPNYVKFLKDILTKKRRLGEFETVALTEGCSAMLKSKIPPKLKDPGSFTIPCSISGRDVGRALCDLGASINLMPMSIFKKLGIGEVRPTTVTLQLADLSMAHPEGKIEDVLVQVDKFIFSADFIILDYEVDRDVPIILGRPFLATGRTLIDVEKGELTMRAQEEQVTFKVFNPIRSPDDVGDCLAITVKNSNMEEEVPTRYSKKVRMMLSLKEFESNNELGASINKASSHLQESCRKKKKKCGRKAHSQRFEVGQRVYVSNSKMKASSRQLASSFSDSFLIIKVFPCGALGLRDEISGREFKVNGQQLKHYLGGEVDRAKTSIILKEA